MASLLPTYHETLGAASVGFSLSCGVFGVLTTLLFIYFRRYPQDTVGYKALVIGVWILVLIDQVFVGYSIYYYTITHFGDPLVLFLEAIVWPLLAQVMVWIIVATIVKTCFAIRVWKFSHGNIYVTGPIFVLIVCQLGCGTAYCIRGFQVGKLLFAQQLRVVASLSLGLGMATDAYIAITLCHLLHKLRTGSKKSDTLINTLIVYAISTGALTGVVSFICLLVYNLYPRSFYFMIFYFLLGKLYAISLVTTINTRRQLAKGQETEGQDGHERTGALTFNPRGPPVTALRSQARQILSLASEKFESPESQIRSVEIQVHRMVSVSSDNRPSPFPPARRPIYEHMFPDPETYYSQNVVPNRRKPS